MNATPRRLAVTLFLLLSRTASARVTVSVDLGWRFFRGLPAPATCTTPFLQNYTGQECAGLGAAPQATTAAACELTCCADPTCEIWQFSAQPLPGGGCWVGAVPPTGCNPGGSWTSFANTTRAGGVPAWAALNFSDAAWDVIDAPHDFIITGANETQSPYVDDRSLQGQAFIPKSVGVYRKHFALPASFAGTHVELYVEGMYAYATYYLNGALLGSHALGYVRRTRQCSAAFNALTKHTPLSTLLPQTSFFVRLDNASNLFFDGRDNVLSVLVDATASRDTGWWCT